MASGSYHSKLFVCRGMRQENRATIEGDAHLPVMEVHCLPIRVISRIKCTAVCIELITKDELKFLGGIIIRRYGIEVGWRLKVYQSPISRHAWYLGRKKLACRH